MFHLVSIPNSIFITVIMILFCVMLLVCVSFIVVNCVSVICVSVWLGIIRSIFITVSTLSSVAKIIIEIVSIG